MMSNIKNILKIFKPWHGIFGLMVCVLFMFACANPTGHIPTGLKHVYDLRTGEVLTPRAAEKADGFYGTLTNNGQFIAFVRYNPQAFLTDVITTNRKQANYTSVLCKRVGAFAGINGSYFNMKKKAPSTFIKDNGVVKAATASGELFRTNGALIITPHDLRIDFYNPTDVFASDREVLAAGPILIHDGKCFDYGPDSQEWDSFYNKRHPRSLIGKDSDGGIWMVVVDGRFENGAEGMTIAELTDLARWLGLAEALNLDGGGSTTLWVLPAGIINHPNTNGQFDHEGQRRVPNIIVAR